MKQVFTLLALVCLALEGFSQDKPDSTTKSDIDTIRVGNIIIVRSGKDAGGSYYDTIERRFRRVPGNVVTNWLVTDIGVNQVTDNTNYAAGNCQRLLTCRRKRKLVRPTIYQINQRKHMVLHADG